MFSSLGVGLFLDKFKVQIVLVLLVVMSAMVLFHISRVSLLEKALDTAQKRNGELVVENAALHAANLQMALDVVVQNNAIAALKEEERARSAAAKAALASLQKASERWKDKYTSLLSTPATDNDCSDMQGLLTRYRRARAEEEAAQ